MQWFSFQQYHVVWCNSAAVGRVLTATVARLADSHCGVWQHCAQLTCRRVATVVIQQRQLVCRLLSNGSSTTYINSQLYYKTVSLLQAERARGLWWVSDKAVVIGGSYMSVQLNSDWTNICVLWNWKCCVIIINNCEVTESCRNWAYTPWRESLLY
jgi:hypothetical protein